MKSKQILLSNDLQKHLDNIKAGIYKENVSLKSAKRALTVYENSIEHLREKQKRQKLKSKVDKLTNKVIAVYDAAKHSFLFIETESMIISLYPSDIHASKKEIDIEAYVLSKDTFKHNVITVKYKLEKNILYSKDGAVYSLLNSNNELDLVNNIIDTVFELFESEAYAWMESKYTKSKLLNYKFGELSIFSLYHISYDEMRKGINAFDSLSSSLYIRSVT